MTNIPDVVTRYLKAADVRDVDALVACFRPDGTAFDEGHTYTGRDEIRQWRESVVSQWTFTTEVLGSQQLEDGSYRVDVRAEGDFPGGVVDLAFRFELVDDLISALTIG